MPKNTIFENRRQNKIHKNRRRIDGNTKNSKKQPERQTAKKIKKIRERVACRSQPRQRGGVGMQGKEYTPKVGSENAKHAVIASIPGILRVNRPLYTQNSRHTF
jgi:hypothetical protein